MANIEPAFIHLTAPLDATAFRAETEQCQALTPPNPRCPATLRHAAAHYGNQGPSRYHCAMFSYRHAFHAGNHADVLKHTVLIATVQYLTEKDAALTVIDTHAGAGLYRLDGDYARTSGESGHGLLQLAATAPDAAPLAPALPV